MDSLNEMLDLLHCRIQFTSPEGDYEGTVGVICPVARKIIVEKIYFLPKRIHMGTLIFQFREILSYTILSRENADTVKETESGHDMYSFVPTRAEDVCILDDYSDDDIVDDESEDKVYVEDFLKEEEYNVKLPPQLSNIIPIDSAVIDRLDDEYHLAINHIKKQESIGVFLDGPKIERHGILSWLCISTSSCTFLFDIESLGVEAFQKGLKAIFENPGIEKIIHDCRKVSDCLFHKFNTKLVNVFDTQVADLLANMQKSKDCKLNKHVSSLDSCLRTYLEVPEEYLYKPKDYGSYQDHVIMSRLRPLQHEPRDLLLKNVMYLRLLKRELNMALLTPMRRTTDVYLQALQNATDRELLLQPFIPEELPQELLMEGIQVVRFEEFVEIPPVVSSGPPYRKLKNPAKEFANYCDKYDIGKSSKCTQLKDDSFGNSDNSLNLIPKKGASVISYSHSLGDGTGVHTVTDPKLNLFVPDIKLKKNPSSDVQLCDSQSPLLAKTNTSATVKNTVPIVNRDYQQANSLQVSNHPQKEMGETISHRVYSDAGDPKSKLSKIDRLRNLIKKNKLNLCVDDKENIHKNSNMYTTNSLKVCSTTVVNQDIVPVKTGSGMNVNSFIPPLRTHGKFLNADAAFFFEKRSEFESSKLSSVTSDFSDEDPWAILRAEFADTYDKNEVKTLKQKMRFIPAGMAR